MNKLASRIDKIYTKSQMLHSLQNALYAAFYCQDDFDCENFRWAFIMLGDLSGEVQDELKEVTECAFGNLKKQRENTAEESGVSA